MLLMSLFIIFFFFKIWRFFRLEDQVFVLINQGINVCCQFVSIMLFFLPLLLVNGHWSAWGSFGPCSRSCGSGKQYRRRACNNPAPSSGGRTCNGPSHQSKACNIHVCAGRYYSSNQLPGWSEFNICFCWSWEITSKCKVASYCRFLL